MMLHMLWVFAKEIDLLTAQAWFSENKQLEERVTKISIRSGIVSKYTHMAQLETERRSEATDAPGDHKLSQKSDSWNVGSQGQRITLLHSLCVGFGNLTATAENTPPDVEEPESPEAAKIIIKAASNCCGSKWERCCCMCCLQCCSKMNDQSAIVLTQVFTALACFAASSAVQHCVVDMMEAKKLVAPFLSNHCTFPAGVHE